MSLVTLRDVVKSFDGVRAVDGLSFSVDRGEVVGLLGPNGAGKTTAMRLITRTLQPDRGTVAIDGRPLEDDPRGLRRRIGYLPETNPLYPEMLVAEYLAYIGRLRGLDGGELRARIDAAVERTGIEPVFHRPISHCSKGYRQRVGLAQAILAEPEILILDEPTEGLDPNQRVEIRELIGALGAERTVLLSTHVLQEVQLTCHRALILHRGRLIADGSVDDLAAGGSRGARVGVEVEAESRAAREAVAGLADVAAVADEGPVRGRARLRVTAAPGADPRPAIAALAAERGWPLWELHLERESLEDLFRELTVEGEAEPGPAGERTSQEAGDERPAGPDGDEERA